MLQNFQIKFFVTDLVTFFSAGIFCNRFFFRLNDTNQQLKLKNFQKIILIPGEVLLVFGTAVCGVIFRLKNFSETIYKSQHAKTRIALVVEKSE